MTNIKTNGATVKWTKDESGIYRTAGYDVDISKAGKAWLVTWGDGTEDHKSLKSAKTAAAILIAQADTDAAIDQVFDGEDDESEETGSKMAKALNKARGAYIKSVASSGKKSLHNGDALATLLAGCEPIEVCQLADLVCEEAIGFHDAKYAHLNQGQQRMNAGNKIRGRIKRNEILAETVIAIANANLPTLKA